MADNLVSQPPLLTPMIDANNMPSRAWSIWFRDLYRRTSYKGGNAIDDNKEVSDEELLAINSSLEETIIQVNKNIEDLDTHELLEEAHGSNGNIVGLDDLADETIQGLVKRMTLISDAIPSTATVVQADASAAPATYLQAHSQELVDLSNANKAAINLLVTDFNNAVTVLNNLIGQSKTSGQMTT